MKQPKALTRAQKEIVSKKGLIARNWMLVKEENGVLTIVNKTTNKSRVIHND